MKVYSPRLLGLILFERAELVRGAVARNLQNLKLKLIQLRIKLIQLNPDHKELGDCKSGPTVGPLIALYSSIVCLDVSLLN